MKHAAVIGAGIGGLAAACLLANKGYRVTIFERNGTAGGKMNRFISGGYTFDTGPSLLTMPFLLEQLFGRCGYSLDQFLTFAELDPLCRYFFADGTIFDNFSDREKTKTEIGKFAPNDTAGYENMLNRAEQIYSRTADAFLFNPLYTLKDLLKVNPLNFLGIDAFSTVSRKVDEYVSSPYLRQFFKRFTTYNGSSPYLAPATLNVIPHVELNQGGYYVSGGLYQIAIALQELAEKLGARFRYHSHVDQIEVTNGKATSVVLKNGETTPCDLLFSNADAAETITSLLPAGAISAHKKRKQETIEPSCSGFVLMLGCKKTWAHLKHHNIFFSSDYEQEFIEIFEQKTMPANPTIYVANTSCSDPGHAPPNSSNLFILVNAPYLHHSQNWEEISPKYQTKIVQELEKRGLTDLGASIECSKIITPQDFYHLYRSNKGSIYGTSSNSRFSTFLRPRNKIRGVKNVYMTGGSTHPGGGIPLVIQSAFNAVTLLERDQL